jgi:hypothetical protein
VTLSNGTIINAGYVKGNTGAQGSQGASGINTLVKTTNEPNGTNCSAGGVKLEYGLDANNNGILDSLEINSLLTKYICNGILDSGTSAGNTPYWNGTNWVVNNSNIYNNGASVGVGTNAPNASSKLEISSTTQGFLMPRMTLLQRNAISSPSIGLIIFQLDNTPGFYYYNGTAWVNIEGSGTTGSSNTNTLIYTTDGF